MRPRESSRSGYVSIHMSYTRKISTPQTRFCPHGDSTSVPTVPSVTQNIVHAEILCVFCPH